jgi:hypothetical protein
LILRGGQIQGFQVVGAGIALWSASTGAATRPVVSPGTAHPTLMWQNGSTLFTDGAFTDGTYVYSLGCVTSSLNKNCGVGRVAVNSVTTPSAWQYYTGNDGSGNAQWGSDPSSAATIFQGGSAGNSIIYVPALNEYMAVYSEPYSNTVYYRTANYIWGPWSSQIALFTGLAPGAGSSASVDYAAHAHPEFAEQNGLVQYIVYSHPTANLQSEARLVRVTFGH